MKYSLFLLLIILIVSCDNKNTNQKVQHVELDSISSVKNNFDDSESHEPQYALSVRQVIPKLEKLKMTAPYFTEVGGKTILYTCKVQWSQRNPELRQRFPNENGQKYGILDTSMNEILPFIYDKIYNPDLTTNGFIEIEREGKMGLFNYKTKKIINCEYDLIFPAINDEIAIGKIGNDYFKIIENGKQKIDSYEELPSYKKILDTLNFDQLDPSISYLQDSYNQYYHGDPHEGTGVVVTPSYLNSLNILPELQADIIINNDGGFGIIGGNTKFDQKRSISEKITGFILSFYEEGADGRGYQLNRKHLVVVNDINQITQTRKLVGYKSNNEFYFCHEEPYSTHFINDSILEVKKYSRDPIEYPKYRSMPIHYYYKIDSLGVLVKLESNRFFDFTKYRHIEPSDFKDCFSMNGENESRIVQLDHLDLNDLNIMRNEIFAEYGYRFHSKSWKDYFLEKQWYKPAFDNVDSLLTPIDKYNLEIILDAQEKLKKQESEIVNKRIINFGMAG